MLPRASTTKEVYPTSGTLLFNILQKNLIPVCVFFKLFWNNFRKRY